MKERTINDVIDCLLQTVQNVFDTRLYYLTQWSSTTGLALTGDEALTQQLSHLTLQDFDILHTSCIYDTARNQMVSYCRPVLVG